MDFSDFESICVSPIAVQGEPETLDTMTSMLGGLWKSHRNAVRFQYAGTLAGPPPITDLAFDLPFENILLRLTFDKGVLFSFVGRDGNSWVAFCFVHNREWGPGIHAHFTSAVNRDFSVDISRLEYGSLRLELMAHFTKQIAGFISLLNHPDQRVQIHGPSPKLNKKRARYGKLPLVEYRTLSILKPRQIVERELGGTHASPRVHLRRGHFRRHGEKIIWVRESLVGDKANGLLLKDYQLRQSPLEAA